MSRSRPRRASGPESAQVRVRELLRRMPDGGPLTVQELFCAELGYQRVDEVLTVAGWPDRVRGFLESPAMVLAQEKDGTGSFDIILIPLAPADPGHMARVYRVAERSIINQLLEDHPLALFVFSEPTKKEIHLVNVRYCASSTKRSTLRRITVDPFGRLDATSERVAQLGISGISPGDQHRLPLTIQRHHDAVFEVEAVSSEFLGTCASAFERLMTDLHAETGDTRKAHDSALRFLSRLVAVYFVQEGGWLGTDPHVLRSLWQAYGESGRQGDTFVSEWLEVLFSRVFCGRLKPDGGAWRHFPEVIRHALAAAPCFGRVLRQCAEWAGPELPPITDARFEEFLGLMEAQRYTIQEPTALDQEVALDPAIVGLLQENLAALSQDVMVRRAGDARQVRGIFYTPAIEIDLMCRLSLVDWLGNHLGSEEKPHLYRVVFAFEAGEKEQADEVLAARKMWSPLRALLRGVKVLDPACGAGAFLVGMLSILDDLLFRADTRLGVQETALERKRFIIEESLYGVDVMERAVEAARVRLHLQLASEAVDLPDGQLASQLTGLAPNVICGDSLVCTPDEAMSDTWRVGTQHHAWGAPLVPGRAQASGFDIVIGNPPYVRQELIRDPAGSSPGEGPASSQEYKSRLSRSVYRAWPRTFGYKGDKYQAQWRLQARNDLYVYFYLQSLALLKSKGTLCFVTSNAWLDARYGSDLRKFLLTRGEVRLIIGNAARRSFFNAEVNTVIGLLGPAVDAEAERPESLNHVARFLTFVIPYDQVLHPGIWEQVERTSGHHATQEWRAWAVRQADLLHNRRDPQGRPTVGGRWGGHYLRAPHIYWMLEERHGDRLKRIGEIADVRRGITTGANRFFFLDERRLAEWGIEEEFLAPVLKSPRGHKRVWLEAGREGVGYVFLCHKGRDELRGTRALDYIRHGEKLGYHLRPTCMSRRRWYDLGRRSSASVHCNYLVDQVMRFFASARPLLASDSFQEIHSAVGPTLVAAAGNSAICQLSVNVFGRSNFGGGLLKVQTYEVRDLLIPDPALLRQEVQGAFQGAGLLALDGPDRRALDGIVFDALELTAGEREAVYEALSDLVSKRLSKARRSAAPGAVGGWSEAEDG